VLKFPGTYKQLPVAFLDITKAFDKVDHASLLLKIERNFGIPVSSPLFAFIESFLSDRMFRTFDNGYLHFSRWHLMKSGVPQGSVLGPLLFLIYINDLPQTITAATNGRCLPLMFADDIAIVPQLQLLFDPCEGPGVFAGVVHASLQSALNQCSIWASRWKMSFGIAAAKSAVVIFRTKFLSERINSMFSPLLLQQCPLPFTNTYKYLGVVLHCGLNWSAQADHIINKANMAAFRLLRIIDSNRADFKTVRLLTNVCLRSVISYGLQFWQPSKRALLRLNSILARPIRKVLHLPWSTYTQSVLAEAGVPPVQVVKEFNTIQSVRRLSSTTSLVSKQLFDQQLRYCCWPIGAGRNINHWSLMDNFSQLLMARHWFTDVVDGAAASVVPNRAQSVVSHIVATRSALVTKDVYNQFESRRLQFFRECGPPSSSWLFRHSARTYITNHFSKSKLSKAFSTPRYLQHDPLFVSQLRARLRFNRAVFKDRLLLYRRVTDSVCDLCGDTADVANMEHILLRCPKFAWDRLIIQYILQLSPFKFRLLDGDIYSANSDSSDCSLLDLLLGHIPPCIANRIGCIKKLLHHTASFLTAVHQFIFF
jgi:hypothetical protein